jgi:hypothetical protein
VEEPSAPEEPAITDIIPFDQQPSKHVSSKRGTERVRQMYGKGFALLSKMGYRHEDSTNTPVAVIPKNNKKGLQSDGEIGATKPKVKTNETANMDMMAVKHNPRLGPDVMRVQVKQWLTEVTEQHMRGPLEISRLPDLWLSR